MQQRAWVSQTLHRTKKAANHQGSKNNLRGLRLGERVPFEGGWCLDGLMGGLLGAWDVLFLDLAVSTQTSAPYRNLLSWTRII